MDKILTPAKGLGSWKYKSIPYLDFCNKLIDYISSNFIEVETIRYLRSGEMVCFILNSDYIVRIGGYRKDYKHTDEINVTNCTFLALKNIKDSYNHTPFYLHEGVMDTYTIGIYKMLPGYHFKKGRIGLNANPFPTSFASFLSDFHKLDVYGHEFTKIKDAGLARRLYKFQYQVPRTLALSEGLKHDISQKSTGKFCELSGLNVNINYFYSLIEKSHDFFINNIHKSENHDYFKGVGMILNHSNIHREHILLHDGDFSGMIDLSDMRCSDDGWADVSSYIGLFVLNSNDITSKDMAEKNYNCFISNYECPKIGGRLNEEVLFHISSLAILMFYRNIVHYIETHEKEVRVSNPAVTRRLNNFKDSFQRYQELTGG